MSGHSGRWTTACDECGGKRLYPRRRDAKARAKTTPGRHLSTYPCPWRQGWHLGHLPRDITRGRRSRDVYEQHGATP